MDVMRVDQTKEIIEAVKLYNEAMLSKLLPQMQEATNRMRRLWAMVSPMDFVNLVNHYETIIQDMNDAARERQERGDML